MKTRHLLLLIFCFSTSLSAMGLRSFVALPVEKNGVVLRVQNLYTKETEQNVLLTSLAYGINAKQTLLFGTSYTTNPIHKTGDISLLYRYIISQNDIYEGTSRFALLGGALLPTKSDSGTAMQAGAVYSYFFNKHEIDIDGLYILGENKRKNSAKYDISWQYRVLPETRDDWGISKELYSVVEYNGKWANQQITTQELTLGLQLIFPKFVLEAGYTKALTQQKYSKYLISIRTHF